MNTRCISSATFKSNKFSHFSLLMTFVLMTCVCYSPFSFAAIPGLTPEKAWSIDGYIKYMFTSAYADNTPVMTAQNQQDHLIHQRLNAEYRMNEQWRINLGMRNRLFWGDSAKLSGYSAQVAQDNGYFDLSSNVIDQDEWFMNSQFDRAYVHWQQDEWLARVGRFRVNWAMATLWNPNDIFNAYSIYDFDYEERAGSDALLVSKKLDFASGFDVVYSPNTDSELDSYAGRYLANREGWDWQLIIGKSGLDNVYGAGFAGDLRGAGFRGEVSYFDPQESTWENQQLRPSLAGTLELDYSFGGRRQWMSRAAMLFISEPEASDSALHQLSLPLTARTLSFTRYTAYVDVGFDLTDLSRLTSSLTYYDDGSWYFGLNGNYSLSDNLIAVAVVQRFDGDHHATFGQNPNTTFFGQLKWNF